MSLVNSAYVLNQHRLEVHHDANFNQIKIAITITLKIQMEINKVSTFEIGHRKKYRNYCIFPKYGPGVNYFQMASDQALN